MGRDQRNVSQTPAVGMNPGGVIGTVHQIVKGSHLLCSYAGQQNGSLRIVQGSGCE